MSKGQRSPGMKNMLSTSSIPWQRMNGMRLLQTACSSSGRHHSVAAMGAISGAQLACGVFLVKHF